MSATLIADTEMAERMTAIIDRATNTIEELARERNDYRTRAERNELLTPEQAATYLQCSVSNLNYYKTLGLKPYEKGKNGRWYIQGEIDEWVNEGRVNRQTKKQ